MEEASWRRDASPRHMGDIWEASRRHLGGIWEASGKHLGGSWRALAELWGCLGLSGDLGCLGGLGNVHRSQSVCVFSQKMLTLPSVFEGTIDFVCI